MTKSRRFFAIAVACAAGAASYARADDMGVHELRLADQPMAKAAPAKGEGAYDPAVVTSRGLITQQGMSGMFINPTSGTLAQGQLTLQYCVLFEDYTTTNLMAHNVMLDSGIT